MVDNIFAELIKSIFRSNSRVILTVEATVKVWSGCIIHHIGNQPGDNRNTHREQEGFIRGDSKTGNPPAACIRKQNTFYRAKKPLTKSSKNKKYSAHSGDVLTVRNEIFYRQAPQKRVLVDYLFLWGNIDSF